LNPDDTLVSTHMPASFGPFHLLEPMACSGAGTLWKAEWRGGLTRAPALVALRVVEPPPWEVAARLARAREIALLDDPRILPIHDCGRWGRHVWFAHAYPPGIDLAELLVRAPGGVPVGVVLHLLDAVLDTLCEHQLVHGGLAPSSILIAADGQIRLCDFVVPAPATYRAPEQRDGGADSSSGDVYALAAVARHLLARAHLPPIVDALLRQMGEPCRRDRFSGVAAARTATRSASQDLLVDAAGLRGFLAGHERVPPAETLLPSVMVQA
jgi:serine/threonine protein kinase